MNNTAKQGYRKCGCYIGANGAVIIRCAKHGAVQWHDGGRAAPRTHPDGD